MKIKKKKLHRSFVANKKNPPINYAITNASKAGLPPPFLVEATVALSSSSAINSTAYCALITASSAKMRGTLHRRLRARLASTMVLAYLQLGSR